MKKAEKNKVQQITSAWKGIWMIYYQSIFTTLKDVFLFLNSNLKYRSNSHFSGKATGMGSGVDNQSVPVAANVFNVRESVTHS